MKKILIQYLYIFAIATVILFLFTWASACEKEVIDETPPICEKEQVSTEENSCITDNVNINTLSDALNKLGESGTLPR